MAQPNRYEPQAGFAEQTRNNVPGRSPVNAGALDAELSSISLSINGIVGNLELIQRDDGSLKDATVGLHALSETVLNLMGGFNLRGEWQADTDYAAKDIVDYQGHLFVCMTANRDAAFTPGNWHRFGEKGAELNQVLRQVAHMQAQVQEEGHKALQSAAQTQQAAGVVRTLADNAAASAEQAADSARRAKASEETAEQARAAAEAAAASAEGAVNNVSGKLAAKAEKNHTHTAGQITDFTSVVSAVIAQSYGGGVGWNRLPNGLILQYGSLNVLGDGYMPVTFPITFPAGCWSVQATAAYNGAVQGVAVLSVHVGHVSASGCHVGVSENGVNFNGPVFWLAIGH